MKRKHENMKRLSPPLIILTLSPSQGFSSKETDFHFHQFLSSFLKYSSNFPSFHPYNIFTINFPGNSLLLKCFSSTISNFSCFLTSAFILPSKHALFFFGFSSSFLPFFLFLLFLLYFFLFSLFFFFCFCHPNFPYFGLHCFLHSSKHLVIFTFPIL